MPRVQRTNQRGVEKLTMAITSQQVELALANDPLLAQSVDLFGSAWLNFVPRPDQAEKFDQQHSFVYNRDQVSFLIKGNASGGTEAAAFKTALFLLQWQPPPRRNTPFWIISDTYEQVCQTAWLEKLEGHGHIPGCEIDARNITWHNPKRRWPSSVPLKPWPDHPGKNWILEFKSYEQGREAMQAQSIGGFWFSEQFPSDIFLEVFRGCRDYMFNGGQFAEFTPIDPDKCIWVEKVIENPPKGWGFYRCNTECNKANLADGWIDQFKTLIGEETIPTRLTGALATFEGTIYQTFNPSVHLLPAETFRIPPGAQHYRGIDWGASTEHPFVCIWGCRDAMGDWWIYDEYWSPDQTKTTADHAMEIKSRWSWP